MKTMNKRLLVITSVCMCLMCILAWGIADILHSGDNETAPSAETQAPDNASAEEALLSRTFFITVPDIFHDLERAPVAFPHDRHTRALQAEGCTECHPRDEKSVLFTFPKQRDNSDADSLMNAFHDSCIGCHNEQAANGKKSGPVTCGECHRTDYHKVENLPILPEYYEPLRDTHHRDCLACHRDPEKSAEEAGGLDWKRFYNKQSAVQEAEWPSVLFDYYLHNKHETALDKKCGECHTLTPETEKRLASEGKEPTCRDWLRDIDDENRLSEKEPAHARCINCHLDRKDEEKQKTGPVYCRECHTGLERTAEQMRTVPRQECEQEESILIALEKEARMPGVAFNHKAHQETSRSCQDCHHDTLRGCRECHTREGSEEGDYVTLAEAFHEKTSPWSCIGCHEEEKNKPDCAGCHHVLPRGLAAAACDTCHTGTLESLARKNVLPEPKALMPDNTDDELEIKLLVDEYELSRFPHTKIAQKLTAISNKSTLASAFHKDTMSICSGCHHVGPLKEKSMAPSCSTCHTMRREPVAGKPALLGAYHQQCLGCHKQMGGTEESMPQKCEGCHEAKPPSTAAKK